VNSPLAGLEWKPFPNWTCSARYRYDDYDDRITGLFEGSVQSLTIATGIAW
jgi:opacity protein-like surface antigen